jgi:hypothetical protein
MNNEEAFEKWFTSPSQEAPEAFEAGWNEALAWAKEGQEPIAWADKISFENAMKSGKGCDVWPKAGDYVQLTGRELTTLYLHPAPQPAIPEGWKLVPIEPTGEMKRAAHISLTGDETGWYTSAPALAACRYYKAMLAAAPEYKP